MDLSIIVVNWNTRDLLAQCLRSVYGTDQGIEFEVVLVDNGSTDGSVQMVTESFPDVRVIANADNRGFAASNNQGLRQSRGRYVLLLNSDTQLLPHTLGELVKAADDNPLTGVVGARLSNLDGSYQAGPSSFPTLGSECVLLLGLHRMFYSPWFPSLPPKASKESRLCDWVGGACLLARRSAFEKVGLLDEGYFMYAEDLDWCLRMHRAGWRVLYCAEAEVVHHGGQSAARSSAVQQIRLYRSKVRFFDKHYGARRARVLRVAVRLSAALKAGHFALRGLLDPCARHEMHQGAISHWSVATSGGL